jgi:MFS family permease
MYSVYSYPNVILPLIGGVLIDKIGLNFSIILFSTLLVIGQAVFTVSGFLGTSMDNSNPVPFIVALIGRVIFGLGGESLNVCQSTIVSRWFIGQEMSLALGINISVSRLGSVFNNYSMPPMADATSLGWALFFGFTLCVLSWFSGLVLTFFEKHACKVDNEDGGLKEDEKEEFHWRDIKDFSLSFWLIAGNCVCTYIGLFCFNNISNDFFSARYGMTQTNSARITSNVFLISAFLAPIFGVISDKFGHKVTFCIVSTLSLAICHLLFILIPHSTETSVSYLGAIPIVLMGLTYSIYVAALWPMVPLVVKSQVVGSAYGLCTAIQNIGLALGPIMVGALTFAKSGDDGEPLRDGTNKNAYVWVNVSLGIFAMLGF